MFRILKTNHKADSFREGYRSQQKCLKNDDGNLVTTQEEIMEKWMEYCEKRRNCEEPVDTFTFGPNKNPYPDPWS